MKPPADRGASTSSMEPLLIGESSRWRSTLHDKALELVAASTRLDQSLPKGSAAGLAELVRSMNCSYSNLIEAVYARLGKLDTILAAAAAHHRLLWIHPFADGNGRVARLMSYAMLQESMGTSGIWSIARGLARNESAYKDRLEDCDQPRHGDLDGRGALSEDSLAGFIKFFLEICVDQVTFMEQLVQPASFVGRVTRWAEAEIAARRLPARSDRLLEAVMIRGEVERGDIENLLGTSERTARRVTSGLLAQGAVVSDSPWSRLRLGFPVNLAHHWLPGLFPEPLAGRD